jgi:hypothetical protein
LELRPLCGIDWAEGDLVRKRSGKKPEHSNGAKIDNSQSDVGPMSEMGIVTTG